MSMKQSLLVESEIGGAFDKRGLTELQLCKFNYELLEMIPDELMPWYKEQYDFSLLEVNR